MAELYFSKEESLAILNEGWNLIKDNEEEVVPIPLLIPDITAEHLDALRRKYATELTIDGDIIPGYPVLQVLSEALARELVESHGSLIAKNNRAIRMSAI